jgi:hypothetical protein
MSSAHGKISACLKQHIFSPPLTSHSVANQRGDESRREHSLHGQLSEHNPRRQPGKRRHKESPRPLSDPPFEASKGRRVPSLHWILPAGLPCNAWSTRGYRVLSVRRNLKSGLSPLWIKCNMGRKVRWERPEQGFLEQNSFA